MTKKSLNLTQHIEKNGKIITYLNIYDAKEVGRYRPPTAFEYVNYA